MHWSLCFFTLQSTDAFIYMLMIHIFIIIKRLSGWFSFLCMSFIVNHDIDYIVVFKNISGSLHWKSAESGPQSTMGCCSRVLARLRSHADETVTGVFESHQVGVRPRLEAELRRRGFREQVNLLHTQLKLRSERSNK